MSASTIARWNAISMTRDPESAASNKRNRSDNDDEVSSDDNISIASRSPSPQPNRDVEMSDVYKYDEHVRGAPREVITVETKLKSSNKGFAMLAKMGWTEGSPLGMSGEGRVDPIPFTVKNDSTGLGKVTQDFRMIEETVSQRRNLDSERMQFETTEQRQQRETSVAQKAAVKSQISTVLRPFYCELCDKQFQNVAQYDEHTNSYAHHHRARTRDISANHPIHAGGREEAERRKEKERKREEKELRKLAKAAGIKIVAPPVVSTPLAAGDSKGFKKSGWASVSDTQAASIPIPTASVSSSGWSAVPPSMPPPPPPSSTPPPPAPPNQGFRSGGWSTLSTSSVEPPPTPVRNGWASDNASLQPLSSSSPSGPPPLPPPSHSLPPFPPSNPPPPPPPKSAWSRLPPAPPTPSGPGKWDTRPPPNVSNPSGIDQPPAPQSQLPSTSKPKTKADEAPAQSRGNWQSFQKMRGRR